MKDIRRKVSVNASDQLDRRHGQRGALDIERGFQRQVHVIEVQEAILLFRSEIQTENEHRSMRGATINVQPPACNFTFEA